MKRAFFLVTLMMLLLLPVVGWATERNIYLSDVADPLEDGTIDHPYDSWSDLPWSTISSWVAAGDDVYINMKRGSVWHGYSNRLQFKASGTADHPITVRPYGTGAKPQIDEDGSTFCVYNYDGTSTYHDYWVIDGLDLVDWSNIAVNVQDCDGFVLKNCEIHDNTEGSKPNYAVLWYGTDGKIQNNYFHDIQNCQIICRINNNATVDTLLIENNTFRRCLDQEAWADGEIIGLPGGTSSLHGIKHVIIRDNIFDTCSKAGANASITIYNSEDVQVLRNRFFSGSARCIQVEVASKDVYVAYNLVHNANFYDAQTATSGIFGILQATGGCTDCTTLENINIANNTAYNIDTNNTTSIRCGIRIQCIDDGSLAMNGIHIKNNIIYANMASDTTDCWMLYVYDPGNRITGLDFDYNDWYRSTNTTNFIYCKGNTYSMSQFATYQSTEGQDVHSFVSDPLLTPNYHLSAGSPCIDAGIKVRGVHFGDYWKDLDGNSTPWGDAPDIGCYEYDTGKTGWAPGWFVRPSGGNYGNEDGTSYENAWDGFSNIVWGTGGVQAGDTLWIVGTHTGEQLTIGSSGTSNNYIIIRGDYPSNAGMIIGGVTTTWSGPDVDGEYYSTNTFTDEPFVVMVNNEVWKEATKGSLSDGEWAYNSSDNRIYLGSNPDEKTIYISTQPRGVSIDTHDYICVKNLTIKCCTRETIGGAGVMIIDSNHILISNVNVKGAKKGVDVRGNSTDCTVFGCDVSYCGDGLDCNGGVSNITFSGNKVSYINYNGLFDGNAYPPDGEAIAFTDIVGDLTIKDNYVIYSKVGISGLVDNNVSGVDVFRNVVDNIEFKSIDIQAASGYLLSNLNIAYNLISNLTRTADLRYAIYLVRVNGIVANNLAYKCTASYCLDSGVTAKFYNNISYEPQYSASPYHLKANNATSVEANNNCYYGSGWLRWIGQSGVSTTLAAHQTVANPQESNSIDQDPLLTSNYHLSASSPCINAGTTISGFHETALDIDKQPILGTPDIGCDERKALWWDGRRWHMQRMY